MGWVPLPEHAVTRQIALDLLRAGLSAGEVVEHAAMGQELPTGHGIAKKARSAADTVKAIEPADALAMTAMFGAVVAIDVAVNAIASDPVYVTDMFDGSGPERRLMRAGFVLASTRERLILLDVVQAMATTGATRSWAAVQAAFAWPRPVPATVTMRERRVLCVDTVSLRFMDADGERHIGFLKAYGFPNNRRDAAQIARALR